jgi:predicted nucleic acid-binding protein
VLVETLALLQSRIGLDAVRVLSEDVAPVLRILWVGSTEHESAVQILLTANRGDLSFVDCISFQAMRSRGIRDVFCFNFHFAEQGFRVFPSQK